MREGEGEKRRRVAGRNNQLFPGRKVRERRWERWGCSLKLLSDLIKIYWKKKNNLAGKKKWSGSRVNNRPLWIWTGRS